MKIAYNDLVRLCQISLSHFEDFVLRKPRYSIFRDRMLGILLVQGASLHYIDGKNGIKDFDVLILFRENRHISDEDGRLVKIPYRRRGTEDSEMPEFGTYPGDHGRYNGRRVDILMREVKHKYLANNAESSIRQYFSKSKSKSMKEWRKKAAIGLWPEYIFGKVLWPHK